MRKAIIGASVCWFTCAALVVIGATATGKSVPVTVVVARQLSLWLAAPFTIIPGRLVHALVPSGPAAALVIIPAIATFWAAVAFVVIRLCQIYPGRSRKSGGRTTPPTVR